MPNANAYMTELQFYNMSRYFGCLGVVSKKVFQGVYGAKGFHTFAQVLTSLLIVFSHQHIFVADMRHPAEHAAGPARLPGNWIQHQEVLAIGFPMETPFFLLKGGVINEAELKFTFLNTYIA